MHKVVTIRDLAKLAGCSRTAVSMALRNHPKISEKNRIKIQQIAQEYGYTRDPVVSALRNRLRPSQRNRTTDKLAVITWEPPRKETKGEKVKDQLNQGVEREASLLGYGLEVFHARAPGMTSARLIRILYTRGIRGLVLMSMARPRGHVCRGQCILNIKV